MGDRLLHLLFSQIPLNDVGTILNLFIKRKLSSNKRGVGKKIEEKKEKEILSIKTI